MPSSSPKGVEVYPWVAQVVFRRDSGAGLATEIEVGLTGVVDDVIALAYPTLGRELNWTRPYEQAALDLGLITTSGHGFVESRRVKNWRKGELPATFLRAARQVSRGRFPLDVVGYLARVRFGARGETEAFPHELAYVPGFLELAAWSLDWTLHRPREFVVQDCALCGVPFLASERARYCLRFAPGSKRQTCQDAGKVRDYQARKKQKERKA